MSNRLIRLRPISGSTSTPDAGMGGAQRFVLPITGLTDGAGVAVDRGDIVYVSDASKHVIFKYRLGAATSQILAGAYGVSGNADGQGAAARFNTPTNLCVDRSGRLWIVDSGNALVRRMDENGRVYTVAAIPAALPGDQIGGIAVDDSENIFLVDNTA